MKVLSVVGARPQFVKLSAIAREFALRDVEHVIVHTGQHYDEMLSDAFFRDLDIPAPDESLNIGSAGHGAQTGAMLAALDDVLLRHQPDWVLVYGDTNSTLAAALSAVKLHFPVAHLEAGLRSFNRRMPEEHNRVLTDHAADLCLAPTASAVEQLAREGLGAIAVDVGDVMVDVLNHVRNSLQASDEKSEPSGTFVATIHRAENTDDPARLEMIVRALASSPLPVTLFAHPRLIAKAAEANIDLERGSIQLQPPASYPALVRAVLASSGVITDSGGLQKEAFLLRVPCTTLRTETEWQETVDLGWNVLANSAEEILAALTRAIPSPTDASPYGIGDASSRVYSALAKAH
ncbi:non-hydrolyzing UDP-N-acetylglucosamine 2-epimerase [Salinibacterium sp. PAMC 21357]|uniref:non-hydrolyzing UDP-N-acetylglucosamine 2-epimerase n=1 Tax=Salinibacterium sp. PAMC 21357 TaxID=1112215 RepID=UPI0002F66A1E|nr:UDP-N-acetylglucosamine 2-epimerase (non-hydrolyzing) [Salinibacterium sp. PAMC 21357]